MRNAMTSQSASPAASRPTRSNPVQSQSQLQSQSQSLLLRTLAIKANSQKAFKPKVADDIVNNAAIGMEKPRVVFMRFTANF